MKAEMKRRAAYSTIAGTPSSSYVEPFSGHFKDGLLHALRRVATRHEYLAGLGLASVSGILWFTACARFDIWPFAWIAMVPALYAIERASSTRRALFFAWWAGFITTIGGFYWVIGLLEGFGQLPRVLAVLAFLLLSAYQALRFLLFSWAVRRLRRTSRLPLALIAPIAMVTIELCVPLIFPWYFAIMQAWQLHVIQIADLTGPLGVTALLMVINGAVYDIATERRCRLVSSAVALCILLAALVYGHLRIGQFTEQRAHAPKIKVGIVEPNVAGAQKGIANPSLADKQLAELQLRSAELEALGADIIVWPESSYPKPIAIESTGASLAAHARSIKRGFNVPLLTGAITYDLIESETDPSNSALMFDRSGKLAGQFNKNNLLIFGEYMPGVETFPGLRRFLPETAGQFTPGKQVVTLPLQTGDGREWRLGPMICLEDILPAFGRKLAALHPHLLVNITDDSWFGDTSEPLQHLALSVYRSVEQRTEMVRAVNPGVSAYIDATGRVRTRTDSSDPLKNPGGADKVLAEVALVEGGHTVYAAVGDLFGYLNVLALLCLMFILPRQRRRKSL